MNDDMDLTKLSALSFDDYYKLKKQNEATGELDNELIFQHDKDNVSYIEAYKLISDITNDLTNVNDLLFQYNVDLVGILLNILVDKKILNKDDAEYFTKSALLLYNKLRGDNSEE